MVDIKTLLAQLKKLVTELSEDLLARSMATAEVDAGLREAYTQIEKGGRTADPFEVWRVDYLDQVAVAWVLGCVFVRFIEDNHLIDECWLAGQGERRKQAEDTHELYFREHPRESDREYFEHVFHEVGKIPACRDLFAEGKTPLWAVGPSGDAAMKLLAFWREIDTDSGQLKRTFDVEDGDTRFLGDLYQDLSERARKKYALLQTPVFVEEFILDRTLDPAINEFGLDEVRMIDPTCGSGHFLLGGFARLFNLWTKPDHTSGNVEKDAQKALDGVWGVDINPFAVAIARFRLIVAALQACGIKRLKSAPGWNIHLATGDSLLFGSRWDREGRKLGEARFLDESWAPDIYACEDKDAITEVLGQQYHAVVGNPPYITVKDKSLNQAYRDRFSTCHRKYSLGVPFTERFFNLSQTQNSKGTGFVGVITTNSFMKREFGKKLIEEFFPRIDLTHVVDTSGAYIPGHGTPTVILFGRNRQPQSESVRAVLGIKGEPGTPQDPSKGFVWNSITTLIDSESGEDAFCSTSDISRSVFSAHPWSIGGGGASELKELIEGERQTVESLVSSVGFMAITGEDEAFVRSADQWKRTGCPVRPFVEGDGIRDWSWGTRQAAPYMYERIESTLSVLPLDRLGSLRREFWPVRTNLVNRLMFGKLPKESGLEWYEYRYVARERVVAPLLIAICEIATHNHFVLVKSDAIFKHSAQIMSLPNDATEDDHVGLVGAMNSSTACFWMKQAFHNKGSTVDQHGARQRTDPFEDFYDHTGTGIQRVPVPTQMPLAIAKRLTVLGEEYRTTVADEVCRRVIPSFVSLNEGMVRNQRCLHLMMSLQEELDWQCYRLYGLENENLCYESGDLPSILCGQRSFEIVMARQIADGDLETTWFERHRSKPITEIPSQWPEDYRKLVARRIELIETNKEIGLIEKPEYKRRWNTESWEHQQQRALRNWLLDRLESQHYWPNPEEEVPRLQSVAELSDKASSDHDFLQVAAIYRGQDDFNLAALVAELVTSESVPFLPVLRYKSTGLRKREFWERTWELQRKEDAGEDVGEIKVPPKYTSADFQSSDYWRLRGKLDVAKERWISFPHCETASDPSLVVGWAGWNHLQQGTAIVAHYDARKNEGWSAEQLKPLLAGLDQLLPWIHQWHPEIDPEYNESAGTSFQTLLESEAQELGLTLEQIRNWTPPAKKKATKKKAEGGSKPRKARSTRKKAETDVEEDNDE